MEQVVLYLGSDHVVHQPTFAIRENSLHLPQNREEAVSQALRHDAAGVLNSYLLDLDLLKVKAPGQAVLSGFESYDAILDDNNNLLLTSEKALKSLVFENATFVCRPKTA